MRRTDKQTSDRQMGTCHQTEKVQVYGHQSGKTNNTLSACAQVFSGNDWPEAKFQIAWESVVTKAYDTGALIARMLPNIGSPQFQPTTTYFQYGKIQAKFYVTYLRPQPNTRDRLQLTLTVLRSSSNRIRQMAPNVGRLEPKQRLVLSQWFWCVRRDTVVFNFVSG